MSEINITPARQHYLKYIAELNNVDVESIQITITKEGSENIFSSGRLIGHLDKQFKNKIERMKKIEDLKARDNTELAMSQEMESLKQYRIELAEKNRNESKLATAKTIENLDLYNLTKRIAKKSLSLIESIDARDKNAPNESVILNLKPHQQQRNRDIIWFDVNKFLGSKRYNAFNSIYMRIFITVGWEEDKKCWSIVRTLYSENQPTMHCDVEYGTEDELANHLMIPDGEQS